jgi:hypothetical protein
MKQTLLAIVAAMVCCAGTVHAADQTWTGTISDSKCGASHKAVTEHNKNMTDRSCTEACVKGGAKYVFASGDKVYMIENQKDPALALYAGQQVTVSGELHGDTIAAKTIAKAKS